jgi:hypothetical protein
MDPDIVAVQPAEAFVPVTVYVPEDDWGPKFKAFPFPLSGLPMDALPFFN